MVTIGTIKSKRYLESYEMYKYRSALDNLVLGLTGKLGAKPWILHNPLWCDLYIGIDVKPMKVAVFTMLEKTGSYMNQKSIPIEKWKIGAEDVKQSICSLLEFVPELDNTKSVVVHKDGELFEEEIEGVGSALGKYSHALVSIRKRIPFRFYEYDEDSIENCETGSIAVLGADTVLLQSTGRPFTKQGVTTPLLIELVKNTVLNYDISKAATDVYSLSFMVWNSLAHKSALPATIKYADDLTGLAERSIAITGPPL